MKYYCVQCQLLSATRNFWCQRNPCGASLASPALGYGDYIEDIKITRLLYFLDSAILYLGERGRQLVLVKVAYPGCARQLIREARTLFAVQSETDKRRFRRPSPYPYLPILLPAYAGSVLNSESLVGHTTLDGSALVFSVLRYDRSVYESCQLLEDALLEQAQPWYQNVVWLTIALADVLMLLHQRHRFIGNLSPRHILVRRDRQGVLRPLLISMGVNTTGTDKEADARWLHDFADSRYLAPELTYLDEGDSHYQKLLSVNARADLYSLGMILLEMLNGRRNFESHEVETTEQIRRHVLSKPPFALQRPDLAPEHGATLGDLIRFTIHSAPDQRPPSTSVLADQLLHVLPTPIPAETRPLMQKVSLGCMILVTVLVLAAFAGVLLVQTL